MLDTLSAAQELTAGGIDRDQAEVHRQRQDGNSWLLTFRCQEPAYPLYTQGAGEGLRPLDPRTEIRRDVAPLRTCR